MTTITAKQYNNLVEAVYETILGISQHSAEGDEVEMGLGEMGDCHDEATRTVDKWMSENNIAATE